MNDLTPEEFEQILRGLRRNMSLNPMIEVAIPLHVYDWKQGNQWDDNPVELPFNGDTIVLEKSGAYVGDVIGFKFHLKPQAGYYFHAMMRNSLLLERGEEIVAAAWRCLKQGYPQLSGEPLDLVCSVQDESIVAFKRHSELTREDRRLR